MAARFKFNGTFVDQNGTIVTGGTCALRLAGTATAATFYSSESSTAVTSVSSTSDGTFNMWVDPTDYDGHQRFKLRLSKSGFTTQEVDQIEIFPKEVDVKDFGALGDGSTDDTTALQDAITSANSLGVSVVIPQSTGEYMVDHTTGLTLYDNTIIKMHGATLKCAQDSTTGNYYVMKATSKSGIRIYGGKILGQMTYWDTLAEGSRPFCDGIYFLTCNDCIVEGTKFEDLKGSGVRIHGTTATQGDVWQKLDTNDSYDNTITNCIFDNCGATYTDYLSTSWGPETGANTSDTWHDTHSVDVQWTTNFSLINTSIKNANGDAMRLHHNVDVTITGCNIADSTMGGIFLSGVFGGVITGNRVFWAGSRGISIETCYYIVMSANHVVSSGREAILMNNVICCSVTSNILRHNCQKVDRFKDYPGAMYEISMKATTTHSDRNVISQNICRARKDTMGFVGMFKSSNLYHVKDTLIADNLLWYDPSSQPKPDPVSIKVSSQHVTGSTGSTGHLIDQPELYHVVGRINSTGAGVSHPLHFPPMGKSRLRGGTATAMDTAARQDFRIYQQNAVRYFGARSSSNNTTPTTGTLLKRWSTDGTTYGVIVKSGRYNTVGGVWSSGGTSNTAYGMLAIETVTVGDSADIVPGDKYNKALKCSTGAADWTNTAGNIYKYSTSNAILQVFRDSTSMELTETNDVTPSTGEWYWHGATSAVYINVGGDPNGEDIYYSYTNQSLYTGSTYGFEGGPTNIAFEGATTGCALNVDLNYHPSTGEPDLYLFFDSGGTGEPSQYSFVREVGTTGSPCMIVDAIIPESTTGAWSDGNYRGVLHLKPYQLLGYKSSTAQLAAGSLVYNIAEGAFDPASHVRSRVAYDNKSGTTGIMYLIDTTGVWSTDDNVFSTVGALDTVWNTIGYGEGGRNCAGVWTTGVGIEGTSSSGTNLATILRTVYW